MKWVTRKSIGFAALLAMVAGVAGSATTAAGSGSVKKTVAVVFYTKGIEYYDHMLQGMQAEANTLGVTLRVSYANFSIPQENDLLQNAIVNHPDGIIFAPMDREALIPSARQAKKQGIAVMTVGDQVGADGANAVLSYVGQVFVQEGIQKAEWLVNQLHGKGEVLIVHGPRGLDYVESQRQAYTAVFKKHPGIKVVEGSYGNLSSDVGLNETQDLLTSHPEANAIWFDHDSLAVGGVEAVRERHIPFNKILLASSGGESEAVAAIKAGQLDFTITERPFLIGKTAIKTMYDYLIAHKVPPQIVHVPMIEITSANVNKLTASQIR